MARWTSFDHRSGTTSAVLWWYRQNVLLFVDYDWCATQPRLFREGEIQNLKLHPIAVVLPELFLTVAAKLRELEESLLVGGHFALEVDDHRMLHLKPADTAAAEQTRPHVTISAPHMTSVKDST